MEEKADLLLVKGTPPPSLLSHNPLLSSAPEHQTTARFDPARTSVHVCVLNVLRGGGGGCHYRMEFHSHLNLQHQRFSHSSTSCNTAVKTLNSKDSQIKAAFRNMFHSNICHECSGKMVLNQSNEREQNSSSAFDFLLLNKTFALVYRLFLT